VSVGEPPLGTPSLNPGSMFSLALPGWYRKQTLLNQNKTKGAFPDACHQDHFFAGTSSSVMEICQDEWLRCCILQL